MAYWYNGQRLRAYRFLLRTPGPTTDQWLRTDLAAEYRKWITIIRQALEAAGGRLDCLKIRERKLLPTGRWQASNYRYEVVPPTGASPADPLGWLAEATHRPDSEQDDWKGTDGYQGTGAQDQHGQEDQEAERMAGPAMITDEHGQGLLL